MSKPTHRVAGHSSRIRLSSSLAGTRLQYLYFGRECADLLFELHAHGCNATDDHPVPHTSPHVTGKQKPRNT